MIDYGYISGSLARFTEVPVRVFRDGEKLFSSFPPDMPKDPMEIYREQIFSLEGHVAYFCTPYFHYYGVVNAGDIRIVAGPTAQIMADENTLRRLAFEADVPPDAVGDFVTGMNAVRRLPVETLLEMLCAVNHFLNNGEKLRISDLAISESRQKEFKRSAEGVRTTHVLGDRKAAQRKHNTLSIEEALMDIVREGNTVALRRWLDSAPAIESGTIADTQLRQMRNLLIVTATLASRAAIRGGMSEDDAFSMSDAYIRHAELLNSHDEILNLQYHMLLEFTEQVEKLNMGRNVSRLVLDTVNYIRHHIAEPVNVEKMAGDLFFSRPYLSVRFREETGQTLTDFILKEKTEEAKRLLRYSDKSIASIGSYLGFSSQAHFSRVFRKYAGSTPGEYRADRGK
ncbi:MAG: helix-turn-helix domain-containing protein [Clostridia bacterium]|nr:helix-turn-helix domain-containing protein [Clostridia bacterium]